VHALERFVAAVFGAKFPWRGTAAGAPMADLQVNSFLFVSFLFPHTNLVVYSPTSRHSSTTNSASPQAAVPEATVAVVVVR